MTEAMPREHLPQAGEFLLWPPSVQPWGYRIVDRLFAHRVIKAGTAKPLRRGVELKLDAGAVMERNVLAGLIVLRDGAVVLERYGLGLREADRWSTMSTVKSMTAMLVGAAVADGAIGSVDAPVVRFLPALAGSAYEGVSLRHLLTMSSGVAWTEVYHDADSDVNRYSRSLAQRVPGGVLRLMASLPRAAEPGARFLYNSGDTFLLGAALRAAVGMDLAEYMARRIWQPAGMEFDAFYTLESEGGAEIGGSRAGMALRDFARFGQFVLDDGVIDGRRVLPVGWVDEVARPAFAVPAPLPAGISHYGYSWWLGPGVMSAIGFAGQRIDVFREARTVVVSLAAFPQPPWEGPGGPDRRADMWAFTQEVLACTNS